MKPNNLSIYLNQRESESLLRGSAAADWTIITLLYLILQYLIRSYCICESYCVTEKISVRTMDGGKQAQSRCPVISFYR